MIIKKDILLKKCILDVEPTLRSQSRSCQVASLRLLILFLTRTHLLSERERERAVYNNTHKKEQLTQHNLKKDHRYPLQPIFSHIYTQFHVFLLSNF